MNRYVTAAAAAWLLFAGPSALANHMESVIAVNYLTVEVVMADPLTEEETDPLRWDENHPIFVFSEGVEMTGAPYPFAVRGFPNTYRIPVNGLDTDIIYKISYRDQKALTFKAYEEREMEERYRRRYGNYF